MRNSGEDLVMYRWRDAAGCAVLAMCAVLAWQRAELAVPTAAAAEAAERAAEAGAAEISTAEASTATDAEVRVAGVAVEDVKLPLRLVARVPGGHAYRLRLDAGQTVAVAARIERPAELPPNARVRFTWKLEQADSPVALFSHEADTQRAKEAELAKLPTAGWSKLLHALDADTWTLYRAPVAGVYVAEIRAEEGAVDLFSGERWREAGIVADRFAVPEVVKWPAGATTPVSVEVRPVDGPMAGTGTGVLPEAEPNDTPEQAQLLRFSVAGGAPPEADQSLYVLGGSDDVEYFDNGDVGRAGEDWYRLEFRGNVPRLLTACLSIPDQRVAARIRVWEIPQEDADPEGGALLPLGSEYTEGRNPNERVHQQKEQHRIAISRTLRPGHVYLLRVEANAPGYLLQVKVVQPAPFDDPRQAIRHALYDHIGQVDSWLVNRPRGASVERRIRDTGNLLGTGCMSCHTQSGVWGPAVPLAKGYEIENVQLFRNLTNTCYQSMRPTNVLVDAANNTSLRPLDIGDGPAGTRVAGHSVVAVERVRRPRVLQSMQAIRAANFILQTNDPGGINAAGPGANVGRSVVFNYAGEVLATAWQATGDPLYFRALEDKVRKVLDVQPKYTDDMCHRVELLRRWLPADYVAAAARVAEIEVEDRERQKAGGAPRPTARIPVDKLAFKVVQTTPEDAGKLAERIERQIAEDLERLRQIQNDDGSWGFAPGTAADDGKSWTPEAKNPGEPSPTALALIAFEAAGFGTDDEAVARGVQALLKLQHPTGLWKGKSQTGFVSTSYALHALSRLFPEERGEPQPDAPQPPAEVGLPERLEQVRRLADRAETADRHQLAALVAAAGESEPLVQYLALVGLGAAGAEEGIAPLAAGLGSPVKMVREAAAWGLRQLLINNLGWQKLSGILAEGDDRSRAAAMRALCMRVDAVLPETELDQRQLAEALARGINDDRHPAVRAWALQAAWQWWVWNPPVRPVLNAAWVRRFREPEPNALVENCLRYHSQALFIANGHKANGSDKHQYTELADLFAQLAKELQQARKQDPQLEARLARRLVGVSATYYTAAGGDGGPGQMGYITPGSGDLFGEAVLAYFRHYEPAALQAGDLASLRLVLEGAAGVPHGDLQQKLLDYSLNGPEELRPIAASSVSDARSAQLVAVPELIEPLMQQITRGASEPARRAQLSDPVLKLFGRVMWVVPENREQQDQILDYLIPQFREYYGEAELKAIDDAGRREDLRRRVAAEQYLAEGLGDAFGSNPDLHLATVLDRFPETFEHPLVARFWLPGISWILTWQTELPDVKVEPGKVPPVDPYEELRSRALRLYLTQLAPAAEPFNRELAVRLSQDTALRRNPEVLLALEEVVQFEKRENVLKMARNVLSTGRRNFLPQLREALMKEEPRRVAVGADGKPVVPDELVQDFVYFRDYVMPEMNRVLRHDQRSCFACHGVPGRVPPLTLARPDEAGYLPVAGLLQNYRLLQDRVNPDDVDRSKLLRKPLNVQTGQEDGHQGGRRYQPADPGYLLLRKWALNQAEHAALLRGRSRAKQPSSRP